MIDHPEVSIKNHNQNYNWLPDFVYGGIDGAVTTFAIVAGVVGASLSIPIILILGFANLIADGFSMAISKYLSDKSSEEQYEKIQQVEFKHLKEKRDHEINEIREIFELHGFKGKQLEEATKVITSNPKIWVDVMMRHEFNMIKENIAPFKGAIVTFISFFLIGLIPLLSYLLRTPLNLTDTTTFVATCISTLLALFVVGAIKSRFSMKNWAISGLQTMFVGGFAASIAYGIGHLASPLIS